MALATYLRLSITDQCDLNCFYCQPSSRADFINDGDLLTPEEIERLVRSFIDRGGRHVRLTGGEPLMRAEFPEILGRIASLDGLERLSLTTNGVALSRNAALLRGRVRSVNVSLDTLRRERFTKLTGSDLLVRVKGGLEALRREGVPVKLNVLLIEGFNDDEIEDFVLYARRHECDVRFIEYFPTRRRSPIFTGHYVASAIVRARCEARFGSLEPLGTDPSAGPARYFGWSGERSRVGFISSVTEDFCSDCNRLRVTADGRLYPCLHADPCVDLKGALRARDEAALRQCLERVFQEKPRYNKNVCGREFDMSATGG